MPALSTADAKRFYDRFGAKQDEQGWYEAEAVQDLLLHADLENAQSVFEFGCGTGRLAADLLSNHLPPSATYLGIDLSNTMVTLASQQLSRFSGRANVALTAGEPRLPVAAGSVDRFISTYVLDLLPPARIHALLAEAHRILKSGGLLCVAGITPGKTALSSVVMGLWRVAYAVGPSIVGGCRPIRITAYASAAMWVLRHHKVVVTKGIASEVLVAEASSAAV